MTNFETDREAALWEFEDRSTHRIIFVMDIDWPARKVEYVVYDAQHIRQEEARMFTSAFGKWVSKEDVYERP